MFCAKHNTEVGAGRAIVNSLRFQTETLPKFALEPFGDLLKRVVEGCARPGGLDDHRPEGESGILAAAEPEIGGEAGGGHGDHHEDNERTMVQRPFGKIGAGHEDDPRRRIF
jgi:hypothetical protein